MKIAKMKMKIAFDAKYLILIIVNHFKVNLNYN